MHTGLKKIFFIVLLTFLVKSNFYGQLTVTSATACPNQPVTLTASWPNVGSTTYTIYRSATSFTSPGTSNFVVGDVTTITFTITGAGQALSGPVTATTTATLTITAPAPLTITQPNGSGNYCFGGTATLNVPLGSVSYTVTGPVGTAFTPFSSNVINIPSLPNFLTTTNSGNYTVTANMSGCIRTGITAIYVSPNSQITITPPSNACRNQLLTLTASIPSSTGGYTWTSANLNGTGPNLPVNTSPLPLPNGNGAQYENSGTYNLTATFSYAGPLGGQPAICTRTANTTVNVVLTDTPTAAASPQGTLCQGANLTLAANVNTGSATYSWAGPNGFASALQTPIIGNVSGANSGIYTVTAAFSNGALSCYSTAIVNVLVVPTADPTLNGPSNVCEGSGSFTLSGTAAGASSFLWSGPGITPITTNGGSVSIIPVGPPVTNSNSGIFDAIAYFTGGGLTCQRTKSITVNVVPVNTISVIPPPDICQPNNTSLNASAVGATSFSWTGPNGFTAYTANTTLYHPPVTASGIYTIVVGFGNSAITCKNSTTVSLLVKPLLEFTITPVTQLVCYNTPVQLTGPAGATSYSWTSSSGYTTSTQNVNLPSAQPGNSGTYNLSVSLDGCISSNTTALTVLDPIQFSQPFFDRSICRGDSIYMEAHVTGGSQDNIAFTWNPCLSLSACTGSVTKGMPIGTTFYNVVAYDVICPNYSISASVKVEVNQPPVSHLELAKTEGCAPLCVNLNTKSGASSSWITYDFGGNLKYQQDSFDVCLKNPGNYDLKVTLTGTNGCSGTYTYPQQLIVNPEPNLTIVTNPESPTVTDEVVFSTAATASVETQLWIITPPGGIPDTSYTPPVRFLQNAGTYPVYLTATTDKGCSDTTVKYLEIRDDFNVYIPNSFTPNEDGMNDIFSVKGAGIKTENFTMDILNRKGQTVYSTRDLNAGWDGTCKGAKAQPDVYVYRIVLVGAHSEGKKQYIGQISLIR